MLLDNGLEMKIPS